MIFLSSSREWDSPVLHSHIGPAISPWSGIEHCIVLVLVQRRGDEIPLLCSPIVALQFLDTRILNYKRLCPCVFECHVMSCNLIIADLNI